MEDSKDTLDKIRKENMFTIQQSFEEFIEGLCKRYAKWYGEILPINDYDYIVGALRSRGMI